MHRSFIDNQAREWTIHVNPNAERRVRDEMGIDLRAIADVQFPAPQHVATRILCSRTLLCQILWVILRPAALADGVTENDFLRGMIGNPCEAAAWALLRAIADSLPADDPDDRTAAHRFISTIRERCLKLLAEQVAKPPQTGSNQEPS